MVPDEVANWYYQRIEEKQRKPTRSELRSFINRKVKCDDCHAKVKAIHLEDHATKCKGYVQRPVASRKFKVISPWPREKHGKPSLG